MELLLTVTLTCLFSCVFGYQNKFTVDIENITSEYVNNQFMTNTVGLYTINETINVVNMTTIWKFNVPENVKVKITGRTFVNNDYKLQVFQVEKNLKDVLEMDSFGVQKMCTDFTRPPAVWPLKKNVPYHLIAFHLDHTKFPPNLPEGKWRIDEAFSLPNKTKLHAVNWFVSINYRKRRQ